jgi:hypothetical protein
MCLIANCNGLKVIWISLHTIEFEPVYQYWAFFFKYKCISWPSIP